ncbi:hypothetical protein DYB32_000501 [Aphanomyces invadans]|nr:hypothetical protein DYB32_000501 [Aphanomyces invadans]
MFGSRGMSRHSDVLDCPVPTEPKELSALVEELKRRGNQAFSKGVMEEAEVLYARGIDVAQTDIHILYSNRSATRLKMGKKELALEDAEAAVAALPTFAKGYFRQGQALIAMKQYQRAIDALTRADSLESGNSSVAKALAEAKDLQAKHVSNEPIERPVSPKKRTVYNTPSFPTSSSSSSRSPKAKSAHVVVEDGEEDLKGVRGYKKLADGRVTTFFNNELTAEDKALIGSIAPKKIDDVQAVQIKNVEGGSAWNQGNSFEEKDLSAFARDRVTQLVIDVPPQPMTLEGAAGLLSVNEVKDMAGDASIAVVRGAKRYIFDLNFSVEVTWAPTAAGSVPPLKATLKFLDMSSDSGGDYDVEVVVPDRYSHPKGKVLHQALTAKSTLSFQRVLFDRLNVFVSEFHAN